MNDEDESRASGVDGGPRDGQVLAALAEWPHPEPAEGASDAFVSAVKAAIEARGAIGRAGDDDLLAPPLPAEGGRESLGVAPAEDARVVLARPLPAQLAGLVDDADDAPPPSGDRKSADPAADDDADDRGAAVAAVPAPGRLVPRDASASRRRSFVAAGGIAALAAGALLFVTARAPDAGTAPLATNRVESAATPVASAAPIVAPAPAVAAGDPSPDDAVANHDDDPAKQPIAALTPKTSLAKERPSKPKASPPAAGDLSDLGGAKDARSRSPQNPPESKEATNATAPRSKSAATPPPAKANGTMKLAPKALALATPDGTDPPAAATEPKPASMDTAGATDGTSTPQKPSPGAVQGAIGSVLPAARACLAPNDAVSRATVTFASSGVVRDVRVAGPAVGTPAEGCIGSALGKARVAPFAEASYAATITVRP